MLSVLIPTYCYDSRPLVQSLFRQLKTERFAWEILLYDDCSPEEWRVKNRELDQLDANIIYREMPANVGRAAIRNQLARAASYPSLLFLDADGEIPAGFIAAYRPFLGRPEVFSGGRTYNDRSIKPDQMLHWYYGRQRESKSAKVRALKPYHGFQTNNFLVSKALMLAHPFDENARHYGHEDTLWGHQLQELGVEIIHLDNAVAHRGLEDYRTFIQKQKQAVQTLKVLEKDNPELPTRLGTMAKKMKPVKPILKPVLGFFAPFLREQLEQDVPGSLYYLDALKLYWYLEE